MRSSRCRPARCRARAARGAARRARPARVRAHGRPARHRAVRRRASRGSREDVGRHNAMDKVVGRAPAGRRSPLHGRSCASAAASPSSWCRRRRWPGAPVLVGVGAPTSLAVSLAADRGLTLCGFARDGRVNVYTGAERVARVASGMSRDAARRRTRTADRGPAGLGHRPLQLPLPVLHARRGPALARARRDPALRGDRAAGGAVRAAGRVATSA